MNWLLQKLHDVALWLGEVDSLVLALQSLGYSLVCAPIVGWMLKGVLPSSLTETRMLHSILGLGFFIAGIGNILDGKNPYINVLVGFAGAVLFLRRGVLFKSERIR